MTTPSENTGTHAPPASSAHSTFAMGAGVPAALWALSGLLNLSGADWVNALNAAGLLSALLIGVAAFRGAARMAASSIGRLWVVGLFVAGVLLLSPAFQRGLPAVSVASTLKSGAFVISAVFSVCLLVLGRAAKLSPQSSVLSPSVSVDRFMLSARVRANLFIFGAGLLFVSAQLSGQSMLSAIPEIILLALMLVAIGPLWRLSSASIGIHALLWPLAIVLACSASVGYSRYEKIAGLVGEARAKLADNKPDEAAALGAKAKELNATFKAYALDRRAESDWAEYYERIGDFPMAIDRWKRVAHLESVPEAEYVPIQRVKWKMGDSLSAWRKLVYAGFPAVSGPEIAQGILSLGERPNADVRAKLCAALVAWDLKLPPDDCRKRLEEVQRVAPNEPSSYELLRRLDVKLPVVPLWMPPELLVGHEPSFHTVTGTVDNGSIEEQGELSSVIVLGEGHWELLLKTRGAPLHEEWPIVRLQLNGHEIGRTQVTRTEVHEIPFTFDVNRSNVYQFRLVFENYMDELDNGKPARRGLEIYGLTLHKAKE